jgi:16S rRNA (guanine966-N2)-methyltransferase
LQTPSRSTVEHSGETVIRPTADRAREALFSIIGKEVENVMVLDLFAGSGALGLEALSRGAQGAVFVDGSPEAVRIINVNIAKCGFSGRTQVLKRDLSKSLYFLKKHLPNTLFSIVFIDAPYRKGLAERMLQKTAEINILSTDALVVVEEDAVTEMPSNVAGLYFVDQRRYGETGFWFYRKANSQ